MCRQVTATFDGTVFKIGLFRRLIKLTSMDAPFRGLQIRFLGTQNGLELNKWRWGEAATGPEPKTFSGFRFRFGTDILPHTVFTGITRIKKRATCRLFPAFVYCWRFLSRFLRFRGGRF